MALCRQWAITILLIRKGLLALRRISMIICNSHVVKSLSMGVIGVLYSHVNQGTVRVGSVTCDHDQELQKLHFTTCPTWITSPREKAKESANRDRTMQRQASAPARSDEPHRPAWTWSLAYHTQLTVRVATNGQSPCPLWHYLPCFK